VISDNGIGFNAKGKKKGIGIQNMLSGTKVPWRISDTKKGEVQLSPLSFQ
jgi:hypothetical protein